ncbi:MAG: hypothetical protein QM500_04930 [Methylococcales bacterium]
MHKCQCDCGWVGYENTLEGDYPNQTCPKCGADSSHIADVLPEEIAVTTGDNDAVHE